MSTATKQLIGLLCDKDFRDHFTADQIYELLAAQVRLLREKNGWTQEELGARAGLVQSAIARLENPDYTGSRISTMSKLARAFDVALIVRYAPFSELADWLSSLSPASFAPASFDEESAARRFAADEDTGLQMSWSSLCPDPYGTASVIIDLDEFRSRKLSAAGDYVLARGHALEKKERQDALA